MDSRLIKSAAVAILILLSISGAASAQNALPDPGRTPGALNPDVTQETIHSTICVRGWTKTIRPPSQYTSALKRQQIREFGYSDHRLSDFEEDHLIPLELGGAPYDERNLWPEPWSTDGGWDADVKDQLENFLTAAVCSNRLPLAEAQRAIASDWIAAFNLYVIGE